MKMVHLLPINMSLVCVLVMLTLALVPVIKSELYPDNSETDNAYMGNYIDDFDANSALSADKRACIRRGGNCDHRPNGCCYNSSCRCNLWGSNCRCQRMGLFQKWG